MNVYDKAHELAKALAESQEYRDFKSARDVVYQNEKNKQMLVDFKKRQFKIQTAYLSGQQPTNEQIETMKKLSDLLQSSPEISLYMQNEYRFNQMISDVYKIMNDAVEIDLDFLDE